jgi:uncharacterized protein YbaR (Trm112 family)
MTNIAHFSGIDFSGIDRNNMDPKLLELLVCPVTKAPLIHRKEVNELWCKVSELAYPIRDDIPVMLADEARTLTPEELAQLES